MIAPFEAQHRAHRVIGVKVMQGDPSLAQSSDPGAVKDATSAVVSAATPFEEAEAFSEQQISLMMDRYKLAVSERQSWRTMLHNSANLTVVLVGAVLVATEKLEGPVRQNLLLVAPIPFLLLHWNHVLDSYHDLANAKLLARLNSAFSTLLRAELWCTERESDIVVLRQMRGTYRHLLHLLPAAGFGIWWATERPAMSGLSTAEVALIALEFVLLMCSLVAWRILATRFRQGN